MFCFKISPDKQKISNFFLIILFVVFLTPYSIAGFSINYSFILYPIILILINGKIKVLSKNYLIFILIFFLILLTSIFYQFELFQYLDRRLISFVIFMTLFSYMFVDIDKKTMDCFKIAIVLIVLFFVFWKLNRYYLYIAQEKGNLKFFVGGSRYGFIYIFAFWIVYFYTPKLKIINIVKFSIIILISAGMFITFSRSTLLAFFGSFALYYLSNFSLKKDKFFLRLLMIIFLPIVFLTIIYNLQKFFPWGAKYFSNTFFVYFSIDELSNLLQRFNNERTSVGFRVFLLGKIFNFVLHNPFTGSGFLGCWIMFDDLKCSAHNQYSDVLFRTGFIGFIIYLYFLFQTYKYLKENHRDLLYGFIGTIIYGFFHETFKVSQGGFIFAFLLGAMVSKRRGVSNKFTKGLIDYPSRYIVDPKKESKFRYN